MMMRMCVYLYFLLHLLPVYNHQLKAIIRMEGAFAHYRHIILARVHGRWLPLWGFIVNHLQSPMH